MPASFFGMAQAGLQRDRAALRKTGEHDSAESRCRARFRARSAPRSRPATRARHARPPASRGLRVAAFDVVPGAHHVAVVDGHRLHRRVRKHEADVGARRQDRARCTIGTKSLPSAPRPCIQMTLACGFGAGFDLDGFEQLSCAHSDFRSGCCGRIARFRAGTPCTRASLVSMYGPPIRSMQYGTAAKMPPTSALPSASFRPSERFLDRLRLAGQVDDQRLACGSPRPGATGSRSARTCRLIWRICSPKPGISLSPTASVASGVTSRRAGPVPPVVSTRWQRRVVDQLDQRRSIRRARRGSGAARTPIG